MSSAATMDPLVAASLGFALIRAVFGEPSRMPAALLPPVGHAQDAPVYPGQPWQ